MGASLRGRTCPVFAAVSLAELLNDTGQLLLYSKTFHVLLFLCSAERLYFKTSSSRI